MKTLFLFTLLLLAGCKGGQLEQSQFVTDQCLRTQLAQQCIKDLPSGPVATKYNDWDEVVEQCDTNAMRQARRYRQYVKPECAL